jgi:hypothetical protein
MVSIPNSLTELEHHRLIKEKFQAKGLSIIERNYLDAYYPYEQ